MNEGKYFPSFIWEMLEACRADDAVGGHQNNDFIAQIFDWSLIDIPTATFSNSDCLSPIKFWAVVNFYRIFAALKGKQITRVK